MGLNRKVGGDQKKKIKHVLFLVKFTDTELLTWGPPNPHLEFMFLLRVVLTSKAPPVNLKILVYSIKTNTYIYYFRLTGANKKSCSVWRVAVCDHCWSGFVSHYPGTTSRAMTHETRPTVIANCYAAHRTRFLVGVIGEANRATKEDLNNWIFFNVVVTQCAAVL